MYIQGKRYWEYEEDEEERLIDLADPKLQDVLYLLIEFLSKRDIRSIAFTNSPFFEAFRDILFKTQTYKIEAVVLDDDNFKVIVPFIQNVYIGQSMTVQDIAKLVEMAPSIMQMTFNNLFNSPIQNNLFPVYLTHLTFGSYFNQDLGRALRQKNHLTHLTFGEDFDQNVFGELPITKLTHLTFGADFNQEVVGAFPQTLTHLVFGRQFNRNIQNAFPNALTHLTFGYDFDRDLGDALLQTSLTHLIFGAEFNQVVKDALPQTLKYLHFGMYFNQDLSGALPVGLEFLEIGYRFNQHITNVLPMGLKMIQVDQPMNRQEEWIAEAQRVGADIKFLFI